MVALIDTNVIIDFLTKREKFYDTSKKIIELCSKSEIKGCIAFHSIPNIWYILRSTPKEKRREWLTDICSFLLVVGAEHGEVVKAINNSDFSDFEDCLQERCAAGYNADYIITNNVSDYTNSAVQAITPEAFIKEIKDE